MLRLYVARGTGERHALLGWQGRRERIGGAGTAELGDGEGQVGVEEVGKGQSVVKSSTWVEEGPFDVAHYMSLLKVSGMRAPGRRLLYAPRLDSTQTLLQSRFAGFDGWRLACVCDRQTAGKGRGENSWESPLGCLMVSFQTCTRDGARLPMLQYLVSLAMVDAVRKLPGGSAATALQIKWPNDLYASSRNGNGADPLKIGGILCQSSFWKGEFVVTIGVGLNVTNSQPTRCVRDLFLPEHQGSVSRESVLAAFFTQFEPMWDRFQREGFEPFRLRYEAAWMHTGQRLKLADGTAVSVIGLSPQGLLRAREDSSGKIIELEPDYNSLDWFQGLLKRKKMN